MATVHCKACGKSYSYEENGCCPSCGAYNRPPRRETVEADGTVHHLDDRAGADRAHAGRRWEGLLRGKDLLRGAGARRQSAARARKAAAENRRPCRCLRSW